MDPASPAIPPPQLPGAGGTPRWVWLIVMLLSAVIVGLLAGLLCYSERLGLTASLTKGFSAAGVTVGVALGIAHYLSDHR